MEHTNTRENVSSKSLPPQDRRNKIISILNEKYNSSTLLAPFITNHIRDLGMEKTPKNMATLRAFIYRMAERGAITLGKENKSLVITTLDANKDLTASIQTHTTGKKVLAGKDIPLSLEALIEAKNKLMSEMETLDTQLEEIVEKKKSLKEKRDELLTQIRELF